jgi:hypothetical protein
VWPCHIAVQTPESRADEPDLPFLVDSVSVAQGMNCYVNSPRAGPDSIVVAFASSFFFLFFILLLLLLFFFSFLGAIDFSSYHYILSFLFSFFFHFLFLCFLPLLQFFHYFSLFKHFHFFITSLRLLPYLVASSLVIHSMQDLHLSFSLFFFFCLFVLV